LFVGCTLVEAWDRLDAERCPGEQITVASGTYRVATGKTITVKLTLNHAASARCAR
jgi:hypothetical protein